MNRDKYSFSNLRRHTEANRRDAAAVIEASYPQIEDAFRSFSSFVDALRDQPRSLERNVRLLLACRFLNHVYSGLLLAEAGLLADAVVCERSAIESLAAYRLLSLRPTVAEEYANGSFPRPVEVRRELEAAGFASEALQVRDLYRSASGVTHISRDSERFNLRWESSSDGALLFGGQFVRADLEEMARFFSALLHWFPMPLGAEAGEHAG
jgi:hypothetical protein